MVYVKYIGTIFEIVKVYQIRTPPEYEVNLLKFNGGLQRQAL